MEGGVGACVHGAPAGKGGGGTVRQGLRHRVEHAVYFRKQRQLRPPTVMRLAGSYSNILAMRSMPAGHSLGNTLCRSCRQQRGARGLGRGNPAIAQSGGSQRDRTACCSQTGCARHGEARQEGRPRGAAPPLPCLRVPLRELVPVAQLGHSLPHILAGGAQQLEDVQQLLQLAVAGEDGLLQERGVGAGGRGQEGLVSGGQQRRCSPLCRTSPPVLRHAVPVHYRPAPTPEQPPTLRASSAMMQAMLQMSTAGA